MIFKVPSNSNHSMVLFGATHMHSRENLDAVMAILFTAARVFLLWNLQKILVFKRKGLIALPDPGTGTNHIILTHKNNLIKHNRRPHMDTVKQASF